MGFPLIYSDATSFSLLEKLKLVQNTCKKDVRMRLNNYRVSIIFPKN